MLALLKRYSYIRILGLVVLFACFALSVNDLNAQAKRNFIKGVVIDQESKAPLPRASVSITSLRIGAVTDNAGKFQFEAPPGEHNVEARYVGYEPKILKVNVKSGETTEITLELSSQSIQTNQIVVVGLTGEVDRNTLGNSISSISGKDVANVVSPSAIDAISGRVPGVSVTRNSGTPGAGTFITMRGRKSILGSSEPLYVVDGIVMDNTSLYDGSGAVQFSNRATDINPQDIESIEILKGASAAAIYGSQAANGVVLITTKKGKLTSFDKPAQITFNTSLTFDKHAGNVPLQTKYGQRIPFTEGKTGSNDSWGAELPAGSTVYDHSADPFRSGVSHEQSLTISGGVPQFDYLINGTYSGIEGYVIGSQLERTNIRANIGATILPGVTLRTSNNYITTNNDLPQDGSNTSGILLGSLRTPPEFNNLNYLYASGAMRRFGTYDNPLWTQHFNTFNSKIDRFLHSTELKWQPITWLSIDGRVGLDRYEYLNKQRLAVGSAASAAREGYILDARITHKQMNLDFSVNAQNRWFDDQLFTTFVLGSQSIWVDRSANSADANSTIPFFDQINAGATKDGASSLYKKQTAGVFAQLTSTWLDRLSLTLAIRRDGSSAFGESDKYHYYPKVGFSYQLNKEGYFDGLRSVFSSARLRGSWGEAGSPSLPDAYQTNFLYGTAGFFDPWDRATTANRSGFIGIKQGGGTDAASFIIAGAKDILPELTIEKEVGVDLGLFDDLVSLEFTYYHQAIFDMILNVPVPTSTGFDQQFKNAAEMWNEGYEITLRATPFASEDFTWSTMINYSKNDNMVTKLNISPVQKPTDIITLGGGFVGIQNVAMVNQPLGIFYGYGWLRDVNGNIVYAGDYIKTSGGAIVRDQYGNVTKTTADDPDGELMTDDYGNSIIGSPIQDPNQRIIGNSNPDFQWSWRNDFTLFQNFTISFLWDAMIGFDVWNGTRGALYNFGTHGDTEDRNAPWFNQDGNPVMDISDPANPVQVTKEVYYRQHGNGFNINENHVQNASYVKLRELTVEYRWKGLESWNLTGIGFSFSARNLLTITDYSGYDPEVNTFSGVEGRGFDYFTLPQVQSFRFGISVIY
ncbi:MAG TPA: SusC/RagA family TonB-linked outer membrane protein [Candidatus Kapabacteria bacterium]|nr:SusC/RagA family TonB-linked outer membrane protein [Candidatus Kapabacteria bacterium]